MNNLQELINEWQRQVALLREMRTNSSATVNRAVYLATYQQLERCITDVELLLLNKDTEQIFRMK